MGEDYRKLTSEEVIQLAHELEDLQRWQGVQEFVTLLYPPEAHRITISVTSEYNDNTYDEDVHIIVTDPVGEILPFDFCKTWWARFGLSEGDKEEMREDKSGSIDNLAESVGESVRALCVELLGIEFVQSWQPHDPITFDYILADSPTVSYSAVYVID